MLARIRTDSQRPFNVCKSAVAVKAVRQAGRQSASQLAKPSSQQSVAFALSRMEIGFPQTQIDDSGCPKPNERDEARRKGEGLKPPACSTPCTFVFVYVFSIS